jgi:hypothetical protein
MIMSEADTAHDGRMSFDEAVHYVQQQPDRAAFVASPVFGERTDDAEQRAEGARVLIIEADGTGSWRMRFVAGPFFATVFAANETLLPDEIPASAKELRYLPTKVEEDWLVGQVQLLIQRLMQANGNRPAEMPDYASVPSFGAGTETVFPISFIGRNAESES